MRLFKSKEEKELDKLPDGEKQVFFFDEMPWLDTYRSGFLSAFALINNDLLIKKPVRLYEHRTGFFAIPHILRKDYMNFLFIYNLIRIM